jgi:hypothetical protein
MLTLSLLNLADVPWPLDLYSNEPFVFSLQYNDVQNIQTPTGSYSQTFTLPFDNLTVRIGQIFEPGYVPDGTENGDERTVFFKKKFPAAIFRSGSIAFRGFVQFKRMVETNGRRDVELVFFSENLDISKKVGDKKLADLDLSAYNHLLNSTNIQQSWGASGIGPEVRYGLIDKGFNWSFPDNPPWADDDGLWQGELTPYMRLKELITQIFTDAGLTFVSDFFDTADFENMYLPAYNGNASVSEQAETDNTIGVGLDGDQDGTFGLGNLQMQETITGASDPGNNWTAAGGYDYTVPYTGYFGMRFHCRWSLGATASHFVKVYLYKNGVKIATLIDTNKTSSDYAGFPAFTRSGSLTWDDVLWSSAANGGEVDNTYVLGSGFLFEAGDEIEIRRETNGASAKIFGGGTGTPAVGQENTTSLEIFQVSAPLSGQTVDMALNMPDLKQMDLLLSLQKMFNLVFIPSGIPNQFIIEPHDDYFATGTEYNWDAKVHRDKSVTMYPTTDLQAKEYKWTYREGIDFISDEVEKSFDRVYGEYKVTDPDNDFATGEKSLETTTGNYIFSLIPGSSFPIHRSLQQDGTGVENPLAMVAYYCGLTENFGEWYLRADDGTTAAGSNFFPLFSPYSADLPTITDNDLNFGMEASFVRQTCNPLNTLYYKYWKRYVRELYSEDSRILECTVQLNNHELLTWKWSNKVFINGAFWRVLSMQKDLSSEEGVKIKCQKVLLDGPDCVDVPTSFVPKENYILFNDSTAGSPDYGSEGCCTKYGYRWMANTTPIGGVTPVNLCRPRNQTIQPT